MTPASEEHRYPERPLEVVGGLFLAQEIDVEQVIAEIDVQRDRIRQQESIAGAEIDGEPVIAGKRRRAEADTDI